MFLKQRTILQRSMFEVISVWSRRISEPKSTRLIHEQNPASNGTPGVFETASSGQVRWDHWSWTAEMGISSLPICCLGADIPLPLGRDENYWESSLLYCNVSQSFSPFYLFLDFLIFYSSFWCAEAFRCPILCRASNFSSFLTGPDWKIQKCGAMLLNRYSFLSVWKRRTDHSCQL